MSETTKFILSFIIWFVGSAAIAGLIRSISTADWTNWVIIVLVLALGGACFWLYRKL